MKEVFEKIRNKLIWKKEYYQKFYDCLGKTEHDADLNKVVQNMLADAIDVVDDVEREHNNGWIPCEERLPEPGKRYLVSGVWKDEDFEKHSVYDAVYGTDGIWHTYEYKPTMYDVTAWQPLPAPYKKGE